MKNAIVKRFMQSDIILAKNWQVPTEFANNTFHDGDYWYKVCSQLSSFKRS